MLVVVVSSFPQVHKARPTQRLFPVAAAEYSAFAHLMVAGQWFWLAFGKILFAHSHPLAVALVDGGNFSSPFTSANAPSANAKAKFPICLEGLNTYNIPLFYPISMHASSYSFHPHKTFSVLLNEF